MSIRPLHILAAGLATIGVAPVANAQASIPTAPIAGQPAAATPRAPRPVARAEFIRNLDSSYKKIDANNDGSLTQAEIQAAQARSAQALDALAAKRRTDTFAKLDTNKDGQLNVAEFNAGAPLPQRPAPNPAQALARLDSNKDKKVSAAEFRAPPLANFDKLDLNRDGTLSVEEQKKVSTAAK